MKYPIIDKTYKPDAVILGNGNFPDADLPLHLLKHSPYTVCCDGAADEFIARGYTPDAIVGDCDSLSEENKLKYSAIIHIEHEQEDNDQTKAIRFCKAHGFKNIVIVGATGKREDHTLGNISLLLRYMQMNMDVIAITDYGTFIPAHGTSEFESKKGQQISIFNFTCTTLIADNVVYPTRAFNSWWQGTLNESKGDTFSIEADGDYIVFMNEL